MSNTALTWAWEQAAGSAAAKAVLVALAEHADDTGCAWPSQQRLAAMTEQSVRSVIRHLAHLEHTGLIQRTTRTRSTGRGRATDHYRLHLNRPAADPADVPGPGDTAQAEQAEGDPGASGIRPPNGPPGSGPPAGVSPVRSSGESVSPDTLAANSATNLPPCPDQPATVSGHRTPKEPSTAAAAHAGTRERPPVDNQQRQQTASPNPNPASGVVDQVRPAMPGHDLTRLRAAVADALDRGCHPAPLAARLTADAERARSPGLLVTIAAQADPADYPPPADPADHARAAAIEQAWRAGREHAYQHGDPADPTTADNAVVAAIEETLTAELDSRWPDRRGDADLRQAFAVGARFQPWTAARDLAAAWTPHTGPAWRAEHATGTRRDTGPRPLQAVG